MQIGVEHHCGNEKTGDIFKGADVVIGRVRPNMAGSAANAAVANL